jgi:hypothetical protein
MRKTAEMELPLHYGAAPPWLVTRMKGQVLLAVNFRWRPLHFGQNLIGRKFRCAASIFGRDPSSQRGMTS